MVKLHYISCSAIYFISMLAMGLAQNTTMLMCRTPKSLTIYNGYKIVLVAKFDLQNLLVDRYIRVRFIEPV